MKYIFWGRLHHLSRLKRGTSFGVQLQWVGHCKERHRVLKWWRHHFWTLLWWIWGPAIFFYAHKMAATYRCRLVTSINTRFSTGIYQKNLLLLPVKNASLVGFKLVETGLFLPQFWPLDSKKCRSFKRWHWKSKFYDKWHDEEFGRERFCWGKAWLRDFVSGAVVWEVIILFFFAARVATSKTFQGFF